MRKHKNTIFFGIPLLEKWPLKTRTDVYKVFTFLKKIMDVCNFSYKTFSIVEFIVVKSVKDVGKKSKKFIFWVKNLLF